MMIQLWPDKEAESILKQHGDNREHTYIFETGFGASGRPHFGTFGEVVRTNYVMLAMRDLGYKTRLIAFSDDVDGLRKVPEGFPDWVKEHIGKPVSAIPDPFGTHESFSAHMNALLVQMLDELGLDYEFHSSTEAYKNGDFNEQLTAVIRNYELVQEIIFPQLRDETKENWFPFFPICENCGRVGTTRVLEVDKENLLLTYVCDREFGGQPGCGHRGQASPLNGSGKLQWKVDWPARWAAYGVNYEMFGKDLIESAEVGDLIVRRVFHKTPPTHMVYEHFLDEEGRKISKSKGGQGIDAEIWQRYGTKDSLMYLMLDKPREAKRLFPGVIPRYTELAQKATEAYYSGEEKFEREARHYQYITLFQPPAEPPVLVDFSTLTNLVGNVGLSDPVIVEDYLRRSDLVDGALSENQRSELHDLILKARRFYDEQIALNLQTPQLDAEDGYLLGELVALLKSGQLEADFLHNELFQIPKNHGVEPKKFFRALYTALIKQERGPRGGAFIKLIGQDVAVQLIEERIKESVQAAEQSVDVQTTASSGLPVRIAPEVKARFPEMRLGVAVIEGVEVKSGRPDDLNRQIGEALQAVREADLEAALQSGPIAAYRQIFQEFGVNPNAMMPSPENILRMAVYENRLPNVNNLVDSTNLIVLERGISVAVYDLDKLAAPLTLRFAAADEPHLPLGGQRPEKTRAGELVYADAEEVICRALNHRDSDKTKVTNKTRNILLIVDGAPGITAEQVLSALQAHIGGITRYAGGQLKQGGLLF
jgi:lysyl-tRNA synthetase, class I